MSPAALRSSAPSGVLQSTPPMRLRGILGVTLGHFLNDFHISWLGPLLPLLVVRFDLSLALAGLLGTILNTTAAFSQPAFGLAADRLPRAVLVGAGPVLTAAAMALTGVLPSYGALIAVLLVTGVGTAAFHPQAAALAGHFSGARRATGLSIFVSGGELAYALGPLYIAAIVQWWGLGWTAAAGLPGVVLAAALAWVMWRQPTAEPAQRATLGAALTAQRAMLFRLWLFVVVRSIVAISFLTFLPLMVRSLGGSLVMGGAAVFLLGGIGAAGGMIGGMLADRVGRRAIMTASLLMSAPLLLLYLQRPLGWGLFLLPLAGITLYLSAPVSIVMAQERMPRHPGLASSIVMGLAWGVAGLSLTAVGAAADVFGLKQTLTAVLGLMVVGLLAVPGLAPAPIRAQPETEGDPSLPSSPAPATASRSGETDPARSPGAAPGEWVRGSGR